MAAGRTAPASLASDMVIVATKLRVPVPRADLVPRQALVAALVGATGARLTLLSAPPGWGKTTLLSEWAASGAEARPFAWVSLEEEDNDPVRFWGLVIEALQTVVPGLGGSAAAALKVPGTGLVEHVVPRLVNELLEREEPVVLVLDDYHVIREQRIHDSLAYLLDHLPDALRLAVATRADPPLPLHRLRARRELAEVRAADLRFSEQEAAAMLTGGLGLALEPEQIAILQRRTEGWAVGLQLAGLSLQGHPEPAAFVASFAGDERQIVDYLAGEVLDAQPAPLREFLVRTSVLERLCGPLCDALTGGADGESRLAALERANLFVVGLDDNRRWYRYHQLFGDVLRRSLALEHGDEVAELHRRAAAWYAAGGAPEDAIRHFLAAGDTDAAAELVGRHWSAPFNRGHLATVSRWLDALPAERVRADPRLWLARAWTEMDSGHLDEAGKWVEAAVGTGQGGRAGEHEAWARVLRGIHRFKAGNLAGAREAADWVRGAQGGRSRFWVTVAGCLRGVTHFWSGERSAARDVFEEVVPRAREDGNGLALRYALGYLALLDLEAGDLEAARRRLRKAEETRAATPELDEHFAGFLVHLAAAREREAAGDVGARAAELDHAVDLARRGAGRLELAYALGERGRLATEEESPAARDLVEEAHRLAAGCPHPGRLRAMLPPAGSGRPRPRATGDRDELSDREAEVLRMLPAELSLREIGNELHVSLNTVKTHARSIYLKLDASSREEAVQHARERGLL